MFIDYVNRMRIYLPTSSLYAISLPFQIITILVALYNVDHCVVPSALLWGTISARSYKSLPKSVPFASRFFMTTETQNTFPHTPEHY